MKTIGIVSGVVLFAVAGLGISSGALKQAAAKPVAQKAASHQGGDVARGKYLVEEVAMCGGVPYPARRPGEFD